MFWKDKVVVITGGSRSLGKQLTRHFAELGSHVTFGYRSSVEKAKQTLQELKSATGNENIDYKKIDVTNREVVQKAFKEILEEKGTIDTLINNAGVSNAGALLTTTPLERWDEIIETNMTGVINCIHAVSLHMLMEKKGSIVNISSIAGLMGMDRLSVYGASKAGVIGLTRALGKEYAPYDVRVNAIAPGYIVDTGMVHRIPDQKMEEYKSKIAMQRLGSSKDIAEAASFLASEKASYITGQTLVVDGGLI